MKSILILCALFLSLHGQAQSTSEKVVKNSCDCLNNLDSEINNYDDFMAAVMKCVSPQMIENSERLKKEFGITETDPKKSIEMIGQKIGEKLVFECPRFAELTLKLVGEDDQMKELANTEVEKYRKASEKYAEDGTVSAVETGFPCQLSIRTESGESLNILWLDDVTLENMYVSDPQKLKGKKVKFVYELRNLYDPKLGKYTSRKVLVEMHL